MYKEWIESGISIRREAGNKYSVFTTQTQHFIVDSLEELTPNRFRLEVEKRKRIELEIWRAKRILDGYDK